MSYAKGSHQRLIQSASFDRSGESRFGLSHYMTNESICRQVILVVDDDPDAHFLLKRAFVKAGVKSTLTHVYSGADVFPYLLGEGKFGDRENYPLPDLILLDLKMPTVNGFDVLEKIQNDPRYGGFPIIVFSSSDDVKDIQKAYALGCESYVRKSILTEDLVALVKALVLEFFEENSGLDGIKTVPRFSEFSINIGRKNNE